MAKDGSIGLDSEWGRRLSDLLQSEVVGHPLLAYGQVTSTNDVARDHALHGAPDGSVVVARVQTNGRGRRGRAWIAYPGQGVYMSVVLRPPWPAADVAWLGVLGGVAASDALSALGVRDLTIKWPNDVLVHGRKIAGVLVEPRLNEANIVFAILGIGLNVRQQPEDWDQELQSTATSCLMEHVDTDCDAAIRALVHSLDAWYIKARDGQRETLLQEWSRRSGADRMPVLD